MTFLEQVADSSGSPGVARHSQYPAEAATSEPSGDTSPARARRSIALRRVVEAEILPRLALARIGTATKPDASRSAENSIDADTEALLRLLIGPDDGSAWAFIEQLEARGASTASLYLGIVTQAARRLGELWDDDRCDFGQVTIGLGRLQQVVRRLSPSFQMAAVGRSAHPDTVLLLPAPGEQHTLGLLVLREFFQREGWHVAGGAISTGYDAVALVRSALVDVVGFSIGSIKHLAALAACIRAVRCASRNRHLAVMVGGPLMLDRPDLLVRLGADTTAADAPSAVRQATGLLALRAAAE